MHFSSAVLVAIAAFAPSVFATPVAAPEADTPDQEVTLSSEPLVLNGTAIEKRSFIKTCQSCREKWDNAWVLECECKVSDRNWPWTGIDLNTCIGNEDGRLVWRRNGNARDSCRPQGMGEYGDLNEYLLIAACDGKDGYTNFGQRINLNEKIHNINGKLQCHL
ncbi:Cyanovirin-N [Naviculisporaceae sp. PSN 640]